MCGSKVEKRLILVNLIALACVSGCGYPNKGAPPQSEGTTAAESNGANLPVREAAAAGANESGELELLRSRGSTESSPAAIDANSDHRAEAAQSHSRVTLGAIDDNSSDLSPRLFGDIKTKPIIHALRSAGDRRLAYWVFGDSGSVTLILGGMHGTEYTPTVLSAEFIEWLEATPNAIGRGRIVVAPLVDPDGIESHRRGNDHGVDLNRNYPAKNWRLRAGRHGAKPLSEPESRFVMELLEEFEPQCIVSIHAPLACVNYDGPAEELAKRMSHACGLPVRASVGYATPGSFGSYAGVNRGIPTITLELRPGRTLNPDFDACRKALLAAHEYSIERSTDR